jgi:hypothetical protein
MNWQKVSTVALSYVSSTKLRFASFLHGIKHIYERIVCLFNLTTAHWWQHEIVVLQNIAARCVNLSTVFASKVFLSLSVFHACRSDNCAIQNHILANMTLSYIPD